MRLVKLTKLQLSRDGGDISIHRRCPQFERRKHRYAICDLRLHSLLWQQNNNSDSCKRAWTGTCGS